MSLIQIIHIKPDKKCNDGVHDYLKNLLKSFRKLENWKNKNTQLCIDEIHLSRLNKYKFRKDAETYIHCQLPMIAWRFNVFLPIIILKQLFAKKIKLIVTLHEWSNTHVMRRIINYFILRFSSLIIVPSEDLRTEISEFSFIKKNKINVVIIPIGPNIIVDQHHLILQATDINEPNRIKIGHFGFLYPLKNPNKVLLTFNETKKLNDNSSLIFIGDFLNSKRSDKKEFNQLISDLKLTKHVHFLGYIETEEEVIKEMSNWNIYISLHENGFSLRHGSTLAALQLGIPVISYKPKDNFSEFERKWLDIITKDKNLIFINKNLSFQAIAEIIIDKINNAKKGQIASLSWIWDEIAEMHLTLYQKIQNLKS